MSEAKALRELQSVQKEAGQVRYLAFFSYVLAVLLAFQNQFLTVANFSFLSLHQIAAPIAIIVTFLQRGAHIALIATIIALIADAILLLTSFISVYRCFFPNQASENCPDKLIQGTWLIYYGAQHVIVSIYEIMSLMRYSSALEAQTATWERRLKLAKEDDAKKLIVTNATRLSKERAAGVERRLSLFALFPTIFFWIFCDPLSLGWLATAAGSRFVRDFFAVWYSRRMHVGNDKQRAFFDILTTSVSGIFLVLSLGAWLFAEEVADFTEFSWDILLDGATSAFNDPFSWLADGYDNLFMSRPEPFFLLFAFIETLVLSNKNKPLR